MAMKFDATTAFVPKSAPRFDTLIAEISDDPALSKMQRRDRISALKRIAEFLNLEPDQIPADTTWLRLRLSKLSPPALGVGNKTFSNLLSTLRRVLEDTGLTGKSGSRIIQLDGAWKLLHQTMLATGDMRLRNGLGRFMRFAHNNGIAPEGVTDGTVAMFREALALSEIRRDPDQAIYYLTTAWNRARKAVDGWPKRSLTVPDRTNRVSIGWDAFPASLKLQTETWLNRGASEDIFDLSAPDKVLSPETIRHRRGQVLRFASTLVHTGTPASEIDQLSVLANTNSAKRGLRWFVERNGGESSGVIGNLAQMLVTLARHLGKEDVAQDLSVLAKRLTPTYRGMTEKNRDRLRPFQDKGELQRLLDLPARLLDQAESQSNPQKAALRVETAVMVGLLLYCPIRIGNLTGIDIERHLVRVGRGPGERVHLVFRAGEVKNRVELEFPLPEGLARLIEHFIQVHRAHLTEHQGRWLFSQRKADAPMSRHTAGKRISKTIRSELGLAFNPHLFRHLAAHIFLQANPGNYDLVRRLLAHKSTSTALDFYTGIETDTANRAFASLIDRLKEGSS